MTQSTLKRCGICEQPVVPQTISTSAGPVELFVCFRCDRRRCGACGITDVSGSAKQCLCGRPLFGE